MDLSKLSFTQLLQQVQVRAVDLLQDDVNLEQRQISIENFFSAFVMIQQYYVRKCIDITAELVSI